MGPLSDRESEVEAQALTRLLCLSGGQDLKGALQAPWSLGGMTTNLPLQIMLMLIQELLWESSFHEDLPVPYWSLLTLTF